MRYCTTPESIIRCAGSAYIIQESDKIIDGVSQPVDTTEHHRTPHVLEQGAKVRLASPLPYLSIPFCYLIRSFP